ncbi:MAG: peptide chain release factor N(5)-glutamine methyltransferase [Gammaproteobacteria bacterium]|nr:peptide chain release factor N(5)-glutamine methyltransferase [Gammaproteobacteria bacterium]
MNRAPPSSRTVAELLATARAELPDPREAVLLVAHALGLSREALYAHPEQPVTSADREQALALVTARAAGQPVAYLAGRREFHGLALEVGPAVLIPRPETELLVELALGRLKEISSPTVADLGTGSGAIALALARERPDASVTATDQSKAALSVAGRNARRLGIDNVCFLQSNWLAPFAAASFDLVVSNPPYVAAGDPYLEQGDLRFEPSEALASGPDGLDAIRRIAADARRCLKPGGSLMLEHGADQQPAVCALLAEHGYIGIETHRDLAGLPRAVTCNSSGAMA